MKKLIRNNLTVLIWLFLISIILRVFHLSYFISYHQDQVRDLFYLKDHFEKGSFILLGPKASVGNFFLPPFWYYLMSLAYLFSKSPLAPAVLTALLSSITTIVIFLFVKKFFDEKLGFITATLYAVSPLSIEYSRFAWNPNPIPLFVILAFYFLYEFLYQKKERGFLWGTIAANLAFQLHYQGLVVFIFYFLAVLLSRKLNIKRFVQYILINFILVLPFFIYEIQNNFKNTSGIINFLIASQTTVKLKLFGIPFFIKFIIKDFSFFLARVMFFKNKFLGFIALFVLVTSLLIPSLKLSKLIKLFLMFSFIMLFFYKNSLIDFYLLFLIPMVIIYFVLISKTVLGEKLTLGIFFIFILINLLRSPAFGVYDKTYLWIRESIKKVTIKKDYCLAYNIFPQTFIESKYRYMMSLVENKPVYDNCQQIIYRCDPKVKIGYYLCEEALCNRTPTTTSIGKLINMKPLDYGVKIYELEL
ncbi:MAG: glycosyltransferase family 39 protein [Candidatus Roizmanbacteria bacterium]